MTIAEQRDTIASALEELDGLRVYRGKTTLSPTAPCAVVDLDSFPPQETYGDDGMRRINWVITLLAPTGVPTSGVELMDAWLEQGGPTSVIDAVGDIVGASSPEGRNLNRLATLPDGTVYLSSEIVFDLI